MEAWWRLWALVEALFWSNGWKPGGNTERCNNWNESGKPSNAAPLIFSREALLINDPLVREALQVDLAAFPVIEDRPQILPNQPEPRR